MAGARVRPAQRLRGGEAVEVVVPPPAPAAPEQEALPLRIVYRDRDLVVVDKDAGRVVHPGAGNARGTLVNALLHHVKGLEGVGGVARPGIVHRLDKDTSGLMVVARNDLALRGLQAQFQAHRVDKVYLALVRGAPGAGGTFRTLHGRDPRNRLRFSTKVKHGKPAVTHWTVLRRLPGATLVEVRLETGRTHQIRAHSADAGPPLLGDRLYGGAGKKAPQVIARQALHAWRLGFLHPRTGARLDFEAQVPADFEAALAALGSEA